MNPARRPLPSGQPGDEDKDGYDKHQAPKPETPQRDKK